MVKLIVINLDFDRSVRFRFELPDTKATEAFLVHFRKSKTTINHGRRWLIYYNARETLLQALRVAKLTDVLEKLKPFENDTLAIGVMLDEPANKPKEQVLDDE